MKRLTRKIIKRMQIFAITPIIGLFYLVSASVCGQDKIDIPDRYLPKNKQIYQKGWIDFNKNGRMDVYENPEAEIEERITDLISQMTLEEKTNQMVTLYGYGRVLEDDLPTPEWKNRLWKDGIGAIDEHLNGFRQWGLPPSDNPYVWPASRHAWALNEVQRFFIEETRLGIPVDFTNEGIRGVESYMATNFPTQLGLGHTWNKDLVKKVGYITGREARLLGYTNVYAPILDVGRDQRWGRYEEVYGESPFLVAELGIYMVQGLQKDFQVASTGKHYAAYSNNKGGREGMSRVDPQMSPREVENVHMYPWERVIREAGLLGVMSAYNDYDGFPIQSSYYWLTTRLRKEMGFRGYVVSDSDAVEYLYSKHGTASDMKEAVYQSVMAGLNVRCTFRSPDSYVLPLRDLIREGAIEMETVDERVRDILRVKFLIGLFDSPYQTDLKQADAEVNSEEHQEVALQASRESIVLLKNNKNILPLKKADIQTIAVCGPNADDASYALTHYGPLAVEVKTVLDGIRDKAGDDIEVLYTKGCDIVDAHWPDSEIIDYPITDAEQAEIDNAVANALKSDVAVVVLGGNSRTAGENKSRSSLDLPGRQLDLLKAIHATGKPVILVLINGRPLSINWADRNIPGIIEAWYPGSQGGTAVADVLFGDYNPGGKLTVTFPKTVGQIPFNFPAKPASQVDGGRTPGPEGNQSRVNRALYPFGYGLSYTTFAYSDLQLSKEEITDKESLFVTVKVKNTGDRAGDEVVQLYTRDVLSSVTTYEKNLRGFERIHLQPGEEKEIQFAIHPRDVKLLNSDNEWVVEPGEFRVMIGASSEDIRLSRSFFVLGEGFDKHKLVATPLVTSDPQTSDALNVLDKDRDSFWEGHKGYFLTFPLNENIPLDHIAIRWHKESDPQAVFEIQISSGGGQFITVFKGSPMELNKVKKYRFNETAGTDLRIRIASGHVKILDVEMIR
ncbi:MAG: glycosyl hydrolase [Bacteroidetes bacterium GWD2_45_23]|nr:MAG: glycosyl hydrolase [Bacteroidetes bacterium GWC2_46_850]OFX68547.1 MAG: glycosyl hydrolase [Bacteroidetes bacterium GWC1_47_7]OFX87323.1 MAG: glycosyl hydrolase [Bacteroidetes bacterium GWD2_45_23]HAR37382.1 glycosyl hydrolase [Porphyromonadaceae bacterium]HBB01645.1 glycosyl hydrolase [Porphyromonadaceae bacterium]